MNHRTLIAALAIMLLAWHTGSAVAGRITLRHAVRLAPDATHVHLGDIATLEGDDAQDLADLVILELENSTAAVELSIHEIRRTLDAADVHWGRTSLSGSSVIIRPRRSGATSPPLAMAGAAVEGAAEPKQPKRDAPTHTPASDVVTQQNLRGMIANYVVQGLGLDVNDAKLAFDERHDDLLTSTAGEAQYEIEPVSNLRSSRIDLTIRVWIDGLIDHRRTVSVSPLVRTPVVIVDEEVRRGDRIESSSLRTEYQWLSPAPQGLVHRRSDAAGLRAATRLRSGDVIRETHLRQETLVQRGEQVTVRCIVGSAVIAMQAEARDSGSEGETIELRKLGERETFRAVITGRNEAILDLSK